MANNVNKMILFIFIIILLAGCSPAQYDEKNANYFYESYETEEPITPTEIKNINNFDSSILAPQAETLPELVDTSEKGNYFYTKYQLSLATQLLSPMLYYYPVATAVGPERYAYVIVDNNKGIVYQYDAELAAYTEIARHYLEIDSYIASFGFLYLDEGEFAIFLYDNDFVMYHTSDNGKSWNRSVIFSYDEDKYDFSSVNSATIYNGDIYLGVKGYYNNPGGTIIYLKGNVEEGFQLIEMPSENIIADSASSIIDMTSGGLQISVNWKYTNNNYTVSNKVYLVDHNETDFEHVDFYNKTSEDIIYLDGEDSFSIINDKKVILYNDYETDNPFMHAISISVSEPIDLDGDGEYERIIGCTSGARVNTISYVMDIYDDNLHFTEIPVQVPVKYESYSSNTIGLMIEGKEPLYFDGFSDTTSIDGFQRKYGNYKVITRNAGITEWDCLKYSKINGEYILCQPVCAGFAGGTAGGITIYAHYRYHDGEIELVEYDY